MVTRKQINRGFYGFQNDDAEFLKPDNTDQYKASASEVGYNARWSDNYDDARSAVGFSQDDPDFRRPSSVGDIDGVNADQNYLIDNDPSLPSNKLVAGGGALSQRGGVGSGPPTHRPKNVGHAGQKDRDSRGGVNKAGTRR